MLTRYRGLGDVTLTAYDQWKADVIAALQSLYGDGYRAHGHVATMPDNVPPSMQQYVGQAAAVFDNATYMTLANAGQIDIQRPQVASNNGQVVFVLAPPGALATQPPTMTLAQRAANAIFSAGDIAADAAGLPSLATAQAFLKDIGREVIVGVGVAIVAGMLIKHFTSRR